MSPPLKLSATDRDFFCLVNETASINPFSEERQAHDHSLAGGVPVSAGQDVVDLVIDKVLERLQHLERDGRADPGRYAPDEAELLKGVLLFDVYYRFADDFDQLILSQCDAGKQSVPVPFAREALEMMCRRGCSEQDALRYFAFFYQLRRAFYFIHNSLVGSCPSMEKLRCDLWNNIFTADIRWYEKILWDRMEDFSVLFLGETGAGKGVAAAAIGRSGFIPYDARLGRFAESFVAHFIGINLSQFPMSLIESELFGHKKGAFTGAIDDYPGILAHCAPHGAIFLDEIGDASPQVQIKLLQVLQERTFSPVGGRETCRFSGRVIAATNRTIDDLLLKGKFRKDFFYRLSSEVITVPSLRSRLQENPAEIDALLDLLVTRILGEPSPEWIETIKQILDRDLGPDYSWPGNVRELEQAVRRIILSRRYRGNIDGYSKPTGLEESLREGITSGDIEAQQLLSGYCLLLYQRDGNYEEVARRTGLDRRTVKKYVLAGEEFHTG